MYIHNEAIRLFAESELRKMNLPYENLSLIRSKDGISVWRFASSNNRFVLKCFETPEYRREITNYQVLSAIDVPTFQMIAYTDCSFVMEDIDYSTFRLATAEDVSNPRIAEKIAFWYKALHENGRRYSGLRSLYDECASFTPENLANIKAKTQTESLPVWGAIEANFGKITSALAALPRTVTYNDFYFTNLAVAHNLSSAIVFDYNMLGQGYAYADIRNVCGSLGSDDARESFLLAYGAVSPDEILVDNIVSPLASLHIACRREVFPAWANQLLDSLKNGALLAAIRHMC